MRRTLRVLLAALLALGSGAGARAETIHLKQHGSVTGKILAEKRDQVIVDLGFTVLSIPRKEIARILRTNAPPAGLAGAATDEPARTPGEAPSTSPATELYATYPQTPSTRSVREWAAILGEAVVQVRTPSGLGSGFILNEEGYLITNFHVIEGETQISVEVYHQRGGQLDRKTYKQVRIVALNKFKDLALLKIEDLDAPRFVAVPLGDSSALAVGERVFAIGSPLGLERTVTEGIVSTTTRQIQGELYLQTTAQINPGNSGGPLFNLSGQVVGVTNMKITFGEGLGFAIPVNAVKAFLQQRDAFAYSIDNPSNPYRYLEPPRRVHRDTETPQ